MREKAGMLNASSSRTAVKRARAFSVGVPGTRFLRAGVILSALVGRRNLVLLKRLIARRQSAGSLTPIRALKTARPN